jgi:hypothetical protein
MTEILHLHSKSTQPLCVHVRMCGRQMGWEGDNMVSKEHLSTWSALKIQAVYIIVSSEP